VLGPQACSHVGDHGPHVGMQVHNVFLKATLVSHQQHVNVLLVWVS
jgi:hypothetical protein